MATRSLVAIKNGKNITSTYIHWDGSPEDRMPILKEHYPTKDRALALCQAGYISDLKPTLQESLEASANKEEPSEHRSMEQLLVDAADCDAEYVYIFSSGQWQVKTV